MKFPLFAPLFQSGNPPLTTLWGWNGIVRGRTRFMQPHILVNLRSLMLSLSDAMDLASPMLASHQIRTAFTVWEICKAQGCLEPDLQDAFVAALMHDAGALSPEEKLDVHSQEVIDPERHCILGEAIMAGVPGLERPARIVRHHHHRWQDWRDAADQDILVKAQMVSLADILERYIDRGQLILNQHRRIMEHIGSLRGNVLSPEVVDSFMGVAERDKFWLDLASPRLYSLLLESGPCEDVIVGFDVVKHFGDMFRAIIDFRSHFTATHSSGVASCATGLARQFGLSEPEVELIGLAGNLHDLGKLIVPNIILEKPGRLSGAEFAIIKQHTYYTYMILKNIGGLKEIPEWAASHHERLNGGGYPFHRSGEDIDTGARIMAVADIFTALAEDRPYRRGLETIRIREIITGLSRQGLLDAKIVKTLFDSCGELLISIREQREQARENYCRKITRSLAVRAGSG